MQETRQQILETLRDHGEATVDNLVNTLREKRQDRITAVTIRHHLNELLRQELIETAHLLHRTSPGRPQHVYKLTASARDHFPDNYQHLANKLISQISTHLSDQQVNVILESVAKDMAAEAGIADLPMAEKLDQAVDYLNQKGYVAEWTKENDDYLLLTRNCPYHDIAQKSESICGMDIHLISALLGVVPRMNHSEQPDTDVCIFRIPFPSS